MSKDGTKQNMRCSWYHINFSGNDFRHIPIGSLLYNTCFLN